jgi:catechol 2,3-dioxygenase-like lactoylglutathione lyase family enzyme
MFQINPLVPELFCSDFEESLTFYVEQLGFEVVQRRGRDAHVYIALQGGQLMLVPRDSLWEPAPMERPFGRGVNFQFLVDNVAELYERAQATGRTLFLELHTKWYWRSDRMDERTQFGVLDPDGYFLRFAQVNRHRPVTADDLARLGGA